MILLTGAVGTVGSTLLGQLQAQRTPFRAAYHSAEKARAARARGIDAVTLDYAQPATLAPAMKGITRLFLLGPSAPNQTELELAAVKAASDAGVRHVVKLSVLAADEEDFLLADIHGQVERAIRDSGMAWTFLRPNSFMQNVVNYMGQSIKAEGRFYTASGEARISQVDVRDIAAVAEAALTQGGHESRVYELTGPAAITYGEMAAELSGVLGREIRHVSVGEAELKDSLLGMGTPGWYVDMLMDLERFYRAGRASRVSGDVQKVTGRRPRSFGQFARDYSEALR